MVGDSSAEEGKTTLKYHDGVPDGKRSLGGSGEMTKSILPTKAAKISGLRIHGARYGTPQPPNENFLIYLLNEDRSGLIALEMVPYALFDRDEEKWTNLMFFDQPLSAPEDFWINLDCRAGATKGVYVSYDSSTDGSRSLAGLPGTAASEPKHGGDWIIEVLVTE
jgi:RNA polymerase sigma-70 factor (ECF subfamily)